MSTTTPLDIADLRLEVFELAGSGLEVESLVSGHDDTGAIRAEFTSTLCTYCSCGGGGSPPRPI